jgi:hypothetical protein
MGYSDCARLDDATALVDRPEPPSIRSVFAILRWISTASDALPLPHGAAWCTASDERLQQ